ncbi:YegP family protein [Arenimonas oryziterrae]|nr:DUF1508 domain-containing protein [Arenimonas oryziterrae]
MTAGVPKQFVLYKDAAGQYRWVMYAANSRKIADSGEGYTTREGCLAGLRMVIAAAPGIQVNDKTTGTWYTP